MAAARFVSKKFGSPIYGAAWTEEAVVLVGGGGSSSSGIKNKIMVTALEGDELIDPVVSLETKEDMPQKVSAFGNTVAVLYSKDCEIFEFDKEEKTLSCVKSIKGIGEQKSVTFSRDGALLALGGEDGHLRVYTYPELVLFGDLKDAHSEAITDLRFSPNAKRLCSVSSEKASASSGALVCNIRSEDEVQYVKSKAAGGKYLEKWSYIWNREHDNKYFGCFRGIAYTLDGPFGGALYLGFNNRCPKTKTSDGMLFMTEAGTLNSWGETVVFPDANITSLSISSTGDSVGVGSSEGATKVLMGRSMLLKQSMPKAHLVFTTTSTFSPCGTKFLSASADSSVVVTAVPSEIEIKSPYPFCLIFFILSVLYALYYLQYLQ